MIHVESDGAFARQADQFVAQGDLTVTQFARHVEELTSQLDANPLAGEIATVRETGTVRAVRFGDSELHAMYQVIDHERIRLLGLLDTRGLETHRAREATRWTNTPPAEVFPHTSVLRELERNAPTDDIALEDQRSKFVAKLEELQRAPQFSKARQPTALALVRSMAEITSAHEHVRLEVHTRQPSTPARTATSHLLNNKPGQTIAFRAIEHARMRAKISKTDVTIEFCVAHTPPDLADRNRNRDRGRSIER